jgi:hypothetical protein
MTLPVIDIKYSAATIQWPDNGFRVQFGNSYVFAAAPTSPPPRTLSVTVNGKRAYAKSDGTADDNAALDENVLNLVAFYASVQLWRSFTYVDPLLGSLTVKFNKPLQLPAVMPGGNGVYPPITLELMEQP